MKIKRKVEVTCEEKELLSVITEHLGEKRKLTFLTRNLVNAYVVVDGKIEYKYEYSMTFEEVFDE